MFEAPIISCSKLWCTRMPNVDAKRDPVRMRKAMLYIVMYESN